MASPLPDQARRASLYAEQKGRALAEYLGAGTDGAVWKTEEQTVVKAFEAPRQFEIELACYLRLKEHGVRRVCGLAVPRFIDSSAPYLIVEMTFVAPPRLIDFGKAYLDREPEHSQVTLAEYDEMLRGRWDDHYGDVLAILWKLKHSYGIFYTDPNHGNICFDEEGPG